MSWFKIPSLSLFGQSWWKPAEPQFSSDLIAFDHAPWHHADGYYALVVGREPCTRGCGVYKVVFLCDGGFFCVSKLIVRNALANGSAPTTLFFDQALSRRTCDALRGVIDVIVEAHMKGAYAIH